MGLFSFIGGVCSSVASRVGSAISSAWSAAKDVAGKAIGWMAEKAEGFVDGVKKVWQAVKPYVSLIRKGLLMAANAIPIPWVQAALIGLEKGLGALTAFENSPIAKKIDEAIKWSIELAKRWQKSKKTEAEVDEHLSEEELMAAKRHQENLRFAEREVVSPEQRHHLELASAINDYEIARSDLANAIDSSPENFEHYLRLRATQKLLNMADKKFRSAQSVDELSADDLFLVRIASDLIKANPELSTEAAARLDRVLTEKYGKKLTPFVFEEMIGSWGVRARELGMQWEEANRNHAKDSMLLKRLMLARDIQNELSAEEASQLEKLQKDVPVGQQQLDALATKQRDIERYVGAAEGFLQLLEKTEEEIEREDRSYLLEDGAAVGKLLIDCAQHERSFDMLNQDQQSLITDYANVFGREAQSRMEMVLEMAA